MVQVYDDLLPTGLPSKNKTKYIMITYIHYG